MTFPAFTPIDPSESGTIVIGPGLIENRGLLTLLATGQWIPASVGEVVAALTLLTQEVALMLNTPDPNGLARPTAGRIAWQ
jgi:hypothetical protein